MKLIIVAIISSVVLLSSQATSVALRLSPDAYDAVTAGNPFAPADDFIRECSAAGAEVAGPGTVLIFADNMFKDGDFVESKVIDAFDGGGNGWQAEFAEGVNANQQLKNAADLTAGGSQQDKIVRADYIIIALGAYDTALEEENTIRGHTAEMVDRLRDIATHDRIYWANIGSNADGNDKDGDDLGDDRFTEETVEAYSQTNRIIEEQSGILNFDVIDWFDAVFPDGDATDIDPDLEDGKGYLNDDKRTLTELGAEAWASLLVSTITGRPDISSDGNDDSAPTEVKGGTFNGYELPATRGGAVLEGSINGDGRIIEGGGGAASDLGDPVRFFQHAKLGKEYQQYYINMRWNYASWDWEGKKHNIDREQEAWFGDKARKILVTNPETGRSIIAAVLEEGPAPWSGTPQGKNTPHGESDAFNWEEPVKGTPAGYNGRVAGMPQTAFDALGLVQWDYGGPGEPGGRGHNLIYAWAPNQGAVPGPTNLDATLTSCYTQTTFGADGRAFPIQGATKKLIQEGSYNDAGEFAAWCFAASTNCHHNYNAADIHVPPSTGVVAMQGGLVVRANQGETSSFGGRIQIRGDDGFLYYYAHLTPGSIPDFKPNESRVGTGEFIGQIGASRYAVNTAPHLHIDLLPPNYDIRVNCSSQGCRGIPFIDIQPALKAMYDSMSEAQ